MSLNVTPTARVSAQLVKVDGSTIDFQSVEFFRLRGMIWVRGQHFEPASIAEVVIDGRRRLVKSIENKDSVCEILFESE